MPCRLGIDREPEIQSGLSLFLAKNIPPCNLLHGLANCTGSVFRNAWCFLAACRCTDAPWRSTREQQGCWYYLARHRAALLHLCWAFACSSSCSAIAAAEVRMSACHGHFRDVAGGILPRCAVRWWDKWVTQVLCDVLSECWGTGWLQIHENMKWREGVLYDDGRAERPSKGFWGEILISTFCLPAEWQHPRSFWLVPEGFVMLVATCRRRRRKRSGLHPHWLLGKPEAEDGWAMSHGLSWCLEGLCNLVPSWAGTQQEGRSGDPWRSAIIVILIKLYLKS